MPAAMNGLQSANEIARSNRTDIYLGVVAPVGIRRESFERSMRQQLREFGYEMEFVRLSELLKDFRDVEVDERNEDSRLRMAMDAGTAVRDRVSNDVLARAAMLEVHARRTRRANRQAAAYVFWSLKHPEEVATLRLVYASGFHLIGLFAPEEERVQALAENGRMDPEQARAHVERDRDEPGRDHGQRTRDTFHLSDVFLTWGSDRDEGELKRFLQLLFGRPDLSPSADEHRMFLAHANALRSGELSRQVGAVLVSEHGDVLAVGANDVPRRRGGLYWPGSDDDRDSARGFDANVKARRDLLEAVAVQLDLGDPADIVQRLERSGLKDITEYGRAVHAEMEALLSCARSGGSTRGGTLYVTTYPCHNCARHIIAAGIERVVYVEPYPKSRALQLHDKDIVESPPGSTSASGQVRFMPHLGIGPRRFFDYFSMSLGDGYALQRKDAAGLLEKWDPARAAPRVQLSHVLFTDLEKALGEELLPFRSQRN